jgi:DNA-binding transcriptional regulator PaaX
MTQVPNHNDRQMMQRLRGWGWVRAVELPEARTTIPRLLQRGWIESEGSGHALVFRLTEEGLAAKKFRSLSDEDIAIFKRRGYAAYHRSCLVWS